MMYLCICCYSSFGVGWPASDMSARDRVLTDKKFGQISESLALVQRTDIQISASLKEGQKRKVNCIIRPQRIHTGCPDHRKSFIQLLPLISLG